MAAENHRAHIVPEPAVWPGLVSLDLLPELLMSRHLALISTSEILREGIVSDGAHHAKADRINQLRSNGCLLIDALEPQELSTFFELTQRAANERLSDGEAAAVAIASHRKLPCLAEDKKVQRILANRGVGEIMTIRQLIKAPETAAAIGAAGVIRSLSIVAACANRFAAD